MIFLYLCFILGALFQNFILFSYVSAENAFVLNLGGGARVLLQNGVRWVVLLMILYGIMLILPKVAGICFGWVVTLLESVLLVADVIYYRGFYTLPSVSNLKLASNLDTNQNAVSALLVASDIWLLVPILLAIIVTIIISIKTVQKTKSKFFRWPRWAVAQGALVLLFAMLTVHSGDPITQGKSYMSLGFHGIDAFVYCTKGSSMDLTQEDETEIEDYIRWNQPHLADSAYSGLFQGYNVISIQVESLESFVVGSIVQGQEITPSINELLSHSYYFPNIYEQVRGGNSSDCDLMQFTSMLPISTGSTFSNCPDTTYQSLPKILKTLNYTSKYAQAVNGVHWNYQGTQEAVMGFDYSYFKEAFVPDQLIGDVLSDGSFLKQAAHMIQETSKKQEPFYFHLITETSHTPFRLPEEYQTLRLSQELSDSSIGGYLQAIHYTDAQIGTFVEALREEGVLDHTILIITGDHAGIHRYAPQSIARLSPEANEPCFDTKGALCVPYLIYSPAISEGKEFQTIGGQVDLMPTLLSLLGVEPALYRSTVLGKNLFLPQYSYAISRAGIVQDSACEEADLSPLNRVYELSNKMIRGDYWKGKPNILS